MKKEWTKPKLVVLFRARADENVLGFCKLADTPDPTGPSGFFNTCDRTEDPSKTPPCSDFNCEALMAS